MRDVLNVLWLDDSISSIDSIKTIFSNVLADFGYKLNPIIVNSLEDAKANINKKSCQIDFILSDLNLTTASSQNGLDFLLHLRGNKHYKEHFILYSKQSDSNIIKFIHRLIKDNSKYINGLINFSFLSIQDDEATISKKFNKCIEIALVRWNEMNSLRGEYAYIFSNIDYFMRKILKEINPTDSAIDSKDCSELIDNISSFISCGRIGLTETAYNSIKASKICSELHKFRRKRNAIVHNIESWDAEIQDYKIVSDSFSFVSKSIASYRKELVNFKNSIILFFNDAIKTNNLHSLDSDSNYLEFIK